MEHCRSQFALAKPVQLPQKVFLANLSPRHNAKVLEDIVSKVGKIATIEMKEEGSGDVADRTGRIAMIVLEGVDHILAAAENLARDKEVIRDKIQVFSFNAQDKEK
jgi:hypothetical protein